MGEEALEFLGDLGISYLPWQQDWMHDCLGVITVDGQPLWASRDMGSVIARQNGKSELAIGRILVGLFLIGEPLIIYCAHEAATAKEIFLRIKGILEDDSNQGVIGSSIKHIWQGNGNYGIEMEDGSRVLFKTRTKGTARGFSCDCLILDEAMFLSHTFAQSVLPSQLARENPQTIVMGSAGVGEDSEFFGLMRQNALGDDEEAREGLTWLEWSAEICDDYCDEDCDEHDDPYSEDTWAKANPSYGVFITGRDIRKIRKKLTPEAFFIECLSVGDWPKEIDEFGVIERQAWEGAEDDELSIMGKPVFAVSTSHDRLQTCIVAAGFTDEDNQDILVELTAAEDEIGDITLDQRPGTKWVVPRLVYLWKKYKPYAIVIDVKGQAGTFIKELEKDHGVKVISPMALEYAQASASFAVGVTGTKKEPRYIYHTGQPELNLAVAGADKRKLSGLWAWGRATDASVILSLEAATLAVWGLKKLSKEASARTVWALPARR